jgi:DNA polymerase III epsilon subunit-like protein
VPDDAIFAVLDVETTGFSPLTGDRIIEIAVVRVSGDGSIADEYATLVNPQRPVGPSDLHGISQKDVEEAPTFEEIAGDVLERLEVGQGAPALLSACCTGESRIRCGSEWMPPGGGEGGVTR